MSKSTPEIVKVVHWGLCWREKKQGSQVVGDEFGEYGRNVTERG